MAEASSSAPLREQYLYTDPVHTARVQARALLTTGLLAAQAAGQLPAGQPADYVIEVPANVKNGDLAANIAMVSARAFGRPPRDIAAAIVAHLPTLADTVFARAEVAGPGFINLFYAEAWFSSVVEAAGACGDDYGRTTVGQHEKVNVEFVSANPTGPMHLGNARGGALGDCLAEALSWAGYDVTREFLINDAGNQIAKFGRSLAARYMQLILGEDAVEFPEDGYQGDDIRQRAQEFYQLHGDAYAQADEAEREKALVDYALPKNVQGLKDDLAKYRIHYDVWFPESRLHESGEVQAAVDTLTQRGHTYEKDGAIWYKTPGEDEKDEVLVRANGFSTYFAADIAYHMNKLRRGFTTLIDAWGADHHGHVARMREALCAVGEDGDALDVVLFQLVNLVRDGKPVRMSKRTGKAITLTDLIEEVPLDSARFFFNTREPGSTIEFDLDLAVAQDSNNPVYYVQYAHARIHSILRNLHSEGVAFEPREAYQHLDLLASEEERALIRVVAAFPGEVVGAAQSRNPARITRYLIDIATAFHRFYTSCRIKGEAAGLLQARLALAVATRNVLKNGLTMLKISAPEQM